MGPQSSHQEGELYKAIGVTAARCVFILIIGQGVFVPLGVQCITTQANSLVYTLLRQ